MAKVIVSVRIQYTHARAMSVDSAMMTPRLVIEPNYFFTVNADCDGVSTIYGRHRIVSQRIQVILLKFRAYARNPDCEIYS